MEASPPPPPAAGASDIKPADELTEDDVKKFIASFDLDGNPLRKVVEARFTGQMVDFLARPDASWDAFAQKAGFASYSRYDEVWRLLDNAIAAGDPGVIRASNMRGPTANEIALAKKYRDALRAKFVADKKQP